MHSLFHKTAGKPPNKLSQQDALRFFDERTSRHEWTGCWLPGSAAEPFRHEWLDESAPRQDRKRAAAPMRAGGTDAG